MALLELLVSRADREDGSWEEGEGRAVLKEERKMGNNRRETKDL